MRRVVVEIPREEFLKYEGVGEVLEQIETAEVLHFLRFEKDECSVIVKIRPAKDTELNFSRWGEYDLTLLESQGKDQIYFGKCKSEDGIPDLGLFSGVGYFSTPFEVINGNFRITLLGTPEETESMIKSLEKDGLKFRILSVTDAKFPPDSPLSKLSERQRNVLLTAYSAGYYSRPRKTNSRMLAEKMKMSTSNFVEHRLKAEEVLINSIIRDYANQ